MKKGLLITVLFFCIVIITGCAGDKALQPQVISDNQKIIYNQGVPVLTSETDNTAIAISSIITLDKKLFLYIKIINKSQTSFDVVPENIQVTGYNKKDNEKMIAVYPPQKYYDSVARSVAWSMLSSGLTAAADSLTAGTSTSNNTAYGKNGQVVGTSTTTTYDPAKASSVEAQDQANIENQRNQGAQTLKDLKQALLWRNTLEPSSTILGLVVANYNSSYDYKYRIKIPIDNDIYEVEFLNQ
jgi:hypothetical protein